jgi:Co/Zn/Cd efflux system component
MVDESTLGLPLLTGVLIFISLFITWYRGADPLVSLLVAFLLLPGANTSHSTA